MLLRYFLNDSEMVLLAPVITGITFVVTFLMYCISVLRSLYEYFKIFLASLLITFISPEIVTTINIHVPCSFFIELLPFPVLLAFGFMLLQSTLIMFLINPI